MQVENYASSMFETFCFADVWPQPYILCTVDKNPNYHGLKDFPIVCIWSKVDDDTLSKFLQDLDERIQMTVPNSGCLFCGIPDLQTNVIEKFISDNKIEYRTYPHYQFWIPPEKQKLLLTTEIQLPAGYYFDTLKLDEAKFVDSTWIYTSHGSLARMEYRIRHLPNVALRLESTGELASFEMLNEEFGTMSHLYTVNEHRRKGLAVKVEEKLAQILIDRNITPFKYVTQSNDAAKVMSDKSQWWDDLGCLGMFVQFFSNENFS